jgi:hypothetical protein
LKLVARYFSAAVEEEGDEMIGSGGSGCFGLFFVGRFDGGIGGGSGRFGARSFDRNSGDGLRPAFIEKQEIFFGEIVDWLAGFVPNHYGNHHDVDFGLEGDGCVLCGDLRWVGRRWDCRLRRDDG